MKTRFQLIVALVLVSLLLAACSPAATPVPPPAPTTAAPAPTSVPAPTVAAPAPTVAAPVPTTAASQAKPLDQIKGKVTIWFDSGATWNPAITQLNDAFKKMAPNVEVEWVPQDTNQMSAKIVAAFSTGSGPDIAMGSQYRLTTAEDQFQAWADLTPLMQQDKDFAATVAALPDVQVATYKRGNKLWGLPEVVQSVGLFVRKSWLDSAGGQLPTDWQSMTDLAKKFTKADQFGYCIFGAPGVTNSSGIQFEYSGAAAGIKYPIIDPDGKPTFNTPQAIQVAKWLYQWQHVDKVTSPATPTFTHVEFYNAVQAGTCGIGRVGAWNVGPWSSTKIGSDFVVIPYPPMTKDQKDPAYQVSWSNGIVMNAKPQNPDAVTAYFKFLMSKQAQTIFFPVRTSWARTDLDFATLFGTNERLLYFAKPQQYTAEMAYHPNYLPILDILAKHLNTMLADSKSDPEKELTAAYNEAMAKYKELGGK